MSLFEYAVDKHGLPWHVRVDQGFENVVVGRYMFAHPQGGPRRRSFIAGKSCQNQKIERLWRGVFTSSLSNFFRYLEDAGLLVITVQLQLFILRVIFTPRINEDLLRFQDSWDNHPLRATQNRTPNQLLVLYVTNIDDSYGVDF